MRATVWAIVLGNRRRQTIALLWEAANAKLADRRHWAILGGALLVLTLATAGSVAFLADKRAANSREVPTVSAIGSLPPAGDAPATPITRTVAVRAAVEDRLSKITSAGVAWKREQGALVEYYSIPAKPLLWVDENGVTDRAKSVLEEIARADDYGLRAIDYELPNPDGFDPDDRHSHRLAGRCRSEDQFRRASLCARCARRKNQAFTPDQEPQSYAFLARAFGGPGYDRCGERSGALFAELPAESSTI